MNEPSKMQVIIDRAENGLKTCPPNCQESMRALIDAVKLLTQAQAQTMSDLSNLSNRPRHDIPIAGNIDW